MMLTKWGCYNRLGSWTPTRAIASTRASALIPLKYLGQPRSVAGNIVPKGVIPLSAGRSCNFPSAPATADEASQMSRSRSTRNGPRRIKLLHGVYMGEKR